MIIIIHRKIIYTILNGAIINTEGEFKIVKIVFVRGFLYANKASLTIVFFHPKNVNKTTPNLRIT